MAGARPILIVDDDPTLRATLMEQLALEGEFAPVEAATAGEAERLLTAPDSRCDAVLLDIGLPTATGASSAPGCASRG
jgi:CheY-like chemotaxis protein